MPCVNQVVGGEGGLQRRDVVYFFPCFISMSDPGADEGGFPGRRFPFGMLVRLAGPGRNVAPTALDRFAVMDFDATPWRTGHLLDLVILPREGYDDLHPSM